MQTPTDVFIDDEVYTALRAELTAQLAVTKMHDPDTEAVRVLGDERGIWPASVLDDVEVKNMADAA